MPRAVGLLWLFWLLLPGLAALEPLGVGLAIGVAWALTGYLSHPNFYCSYVECCPSAGQRLNATGTAGAGGTAGPRWAPQPCPGARPVTGHCPGRPPVCLAVPVPC